MGSGQIARACTPSPGYPGPRVATSPSNGPATEQQLGLLAYALPYLLRDKDSLMKSVCEDVCVCMCISARKSIKALTCADLCNGSTWYCPSYVHSIELGMWYTKSTRRKVGEAILGAWPVPGPEKSLGITASFSPMRQPENGWQNPGSSLLKA